jgi:hypothetical protein
MVPLVEIRVKDVDDAFIPPCACKSVSQEVIEAILTKNGR